MNPLLPTGYDIVWSIAVVALAVYAVSALVSIWRVQASLSGFAVVGWMLLVVVAPLLGATAWFLFGRPRAVASTAD